ncbi:ABC-type transport system involved in resistance to organic solvent, periplasmic component [Candidatus Burkholderia pumila]|uniref:ABC-type transport system involved in resistance to organic solvent, periplasmic component n=1 Tax=Candidatus Burkholderia pumila TaxID=1090375 RepID=A0ABR5HKS1_9BURK|nr:ABC-type transport system involved in resistance to organic solvent, periplasmic component [Candidatus Burkholderia pumila]
MENKSHAFWTGLFTIVLMLAIAFAVFFFNVDRTVRMPYDLIARTNVTGLFTDAAVRYRGLGVGKVEAIKFDKSHPGQIRIRILVDQNAPMTHSTYATLDFQGVTGIAFVQLDDTGKDTQALTSSPQHVAEVPMRVGLFEQLQERGDVILKKFEHLSDDADKFFSDDVHNQLLDTMKSLKGAADGIAMLASSVQPATSQLPQTLKRLDTTLASTNQLVQNLNRPDGSFVTNLNKAGKAAEDASATFQDMNESLRYMTARVGFEALPRLYSLGDDVGAAARSVDRAANAFSTNPRSVIFGAPQQALGPGEPGFTWPAKSAH